MTNKWLRAGLWVLCAVIIAGSVFVVSSPNMLSEVKARLMSDEEDDESWEEGLLNLLIPGAMAEETEVREVSELKCDQPLPIDFSVPPMPMGTYTEDGYEDESIRVRLEELNENGTVWHVAYVEVASPTQLRTATAVPGKLTSSKTAYVSTMAAYNNAVVALSGDNFVDKPDKTTYEFRMGQKVREKGNRYKDVLFIDAEGDFHFLLANPGNTAKEHTSLTKEEAAKYEIVNAFTFGPVLVLDGEVFDLEARTVTWHKQYDQGYGYNPEAKEPRAAIGQTGKLSYVFVVAEGRDGSNSAGATQQELADFMKRIGCIQAYNLDGGNSAEMVFNRNGRIEQDKKGNSLSVYDQTLMKGMPSGKERSLSDIIYFATAVPDGN